MVISAFTLNELPTDQVRNIVLETLWKSTQDILVSFRIAFMLFMNGIFKVTGLTGTYRERDSGGVPGNNSRKTKILQMENKKTESNAVADAETTIGPGGAHVVAPVMICAYVRALFMRQRDN